MTTRTTSSQGVKLQQQQEDADDEETPLLTSTHTQEGSIQGGLQMMIPPLPGMKIRCHRLSSSSNSKQHQEITSCTTSEALLGAKRGNDHYWIDIENPHNAENGGGDGLRAWLQELQSLPNFVIDVLSEPPEMWASQVIPLPKAILAIIRILPKVSESDEMAHVAALGLRNMLITFTTASSSSTSCCGGAGAAGHHYSHPQYSSSFTTTNSKGDPTATGSLYSLELLQMKERLPAPNSSGALLAWLRFHLDRTSRSTRELRNSVLAMDEAMDRDMASVELEEIISVKDQLLRLLAVAEEQTECLESLEAATTAAAAASSSTSNNSGAFSFASSSSSSPLHGSFSVLLATAGSTERMCVRLEKQILDLRQRCENHEQMKMNRRLAVLTVLSAVFLPLTLFTGIWGMNFEDMPELNKPYAYPLALMFMLCVAAIMVCYFRKTGWFD